MAEGTISLEGSIFNRIYRKSLTLRHRLSDYEIWNDE